MATVPKYRGFKWTQGDASNPALALVLDETSKSLHVTIPTDVGTDWNVAADSNPAIYLHSDTTPATDYLLVGRHTGTAADIDLVGGATLNFKIDGTAEALMTATIFDLASTDLQMQTGGQILDNNGNELVEFVIGNASAVNGVKIRNAATGVAPWITNEGGEDIGLVLGNHDGTNWEEILVLVQTASAANGIRIVNSATGTKPIITNEGEADTGITFANYDGTNTEEMLVLVATATATNGIRIVNNTTGLNPTITNEGEADTGITLANYDGTNTEELLILDAVATAVNEVTISNATTGVGPTIKSSGETNVDLQIDTKGTGALVILLGGDETLKLHDAGAMTFSAAADTAGHAAYLQSEDGGAASADTAGVAGGLTEVRTGDGSAGGAHSANNPAGGNGGALTLVTGAGGTGGASGSGAGGNGGTLAITAGAAANAGAGGTGAGGTGGAITITAGAGGNGVGSGNGGAGGDITLTPGAAGTNGTPGRAGAVLVLGGKILAASSSTEVGISVGNDVTMVVGSAGSLRAPYVDSTDAAFTDAVGGDVNGCIGIQRDSDGGPVLTLEARVNGAWVSVAMSGTVFPAKREYDPKAKGYHVHKAQVFKAEGRTWVDESRCADCGEPIEVGQNAMFLANAKRSNGDIHAIYSHLHGNDSFKAAVKEALGDSDFRKFIKEALKN